MKKLFEQDLKVVNVGLQGFADNIVAAGGRATHLSWAPPAGANAALGWTLACQVGDQRIEEANRVAYERYLAAQPRLVDLVLAKDEATGALAPKRVLKTFRRVSNHLRVLRVRDSARLCRRSETRSLTASHTHERTW